MTTQVVFAGGTEGWGGGFWGFGKGDGLPIETGWVLGGKGGGQKGSKRRQKDHGGASKQCIFR
jgi:hypothetical protein